MSRYAKSAVVSLPLVGRDQGWGNFTGAAPVTPPTPALPTRGREKEEGESYVQIGKRP
jgi:hypothetical protein